MTTPGSAEIRLAIHRPTPAHYMGPFTGFGPGGNGLAILAWINDNGGTAYERDGLIYIKRDGEEDHTPQISRYWIDLGDRVARRIRPDGTPTGDFHPLKPEVWADFYDDQGPVSS